MARLCTVRFLSAVRAVAAHCKHPFALRLGLSCEDVARTKEITNEEKKESGPLPLLLSYRRQEVRRGQEQRQFPPSARLLSARPPPPATPAPPAPTARSRRPPLPAAAPAFPHPWWIGSPALLALTSHPPGGPGPSICPSTSRFPSSPPPRGSSAGPSTRDTP